MKKAIYYYAGIVLGIVGVISIIVTITVSPKIYAGYIVGAICFLGCFSMIIISLYLENDNIVRDISTIEGNTPTEEIAIMLSKQELSSKLKVLNYEFRGNLCVYMEIENDGIYHVSLYKNILEIENFDLETENKLNDLQEKYKGEIDENIKKNYEVEIYNLINTTNSRYAKEKIKGKTKEEIIEIIENKILY